MQSFIIGVIVRCLPSREPRRPGQILVMFALMVFVLMGFAAMAVDVGMALQVKRQYQKIAEVCAVQGAQNLATSAGSSTSSAQSCISTNLPGVSASVSVPPTAGSKSGDSQFLEVVITGQPPTYFARALGINQLSAYGRAVAGGFQPVDWGMIGLRRDAHSTVSNGGSGATINASACTAGVFDVNGNMQVNGEAAANQGFDGSPTSTAGNFVPGPPCLDPQYPLPIQSSLPSYSDPPQSGTFTVADNGSPDLNCPDAPTTPSVTVPSSNTAAEVRIDCNNSKSGTVIVQGPRKYLNIRRGGNDLVVDVQSSVIQNICNGSGNCGGNFSGTVKLAPGYYDVIDANDLGGSAKLVLKSGLHIISTGLQLGNLQMSNEGGVSIIVGLRFDVHGNGTVNLQCCASSMQNGILVYHIGGCLPPFAPAVSGTPSPFPKWPGGWTCQTGVPNWVSNQIDLQGNNSSRTFVGPTTTPGAAGSIYSPYLCLNTIATSCATPIPTPGAPTPGTISNCVNGSNYPTPRFPCNTPQFDCPSGGCILVGGSGGTTIQGQLIGPDLQFNGNGIVLTYNPANQNSGFRPYLAE